MIGIGTVAGVLGVFTKLIAKLEAIKIKQEIKEDKLMEQIADKEHKCNVARQEITDADKAIAKLKSFLD